MIKLIQILITLLISVLTFANCTKQEITLYEREPEKIIESFNIVNTTQSLQGQINHQEKTITVVIPEGEFYTALEPEIKLAPGYKLKENADTIITDLVDYFAHGRDIRYPIADINGVTTNYKLSIKSIQTPLRLEEISPSEKNIYSIDMAIEDANTQTLKLTVNPSNYRFSDNFETNREISRGYAIDSQGKEYPIEYLIVNDQIMHIYIKSIKGHTIFIPNKPPQYTKEPPAGLYHIKVQYYSRIYQLKNPIRIYYSK